MDEDEDDAEGEEDFAVTGPLKKVSDPILFRFRRVARAGKKIIRGGRRLIRRFRRRRRSRRPSRRRSRRPSRRPSRRRRRFRLRRG